MRRGGAAVGLLLLSGFGFAADPVRAYAAPDGSVRLWLKEAPSVTATDVAGWQIVPRAAETNATWLGRLKKIYPQEPGSPWKALLEDVRAAAPREGVELIQPSGTITATVGGSGVLVSAGGTSVQFSETKESWNSANVADLDKWLRGVTRGGSTLAPLYRFASQPVPPDASAAGAWSAFLEALSHTTVTKPLIFEGANPVVIEAKPFVTPAPPKTNSTPKTDAKADPKAGTKATDPMPWIFIGLAAVVGLGVGYGARAAQKPKTATVPPDDASLKHRIASSASEAERLAADLERAKAALAEANRTSKQYRDEHGAWVRDRDETLRTLQDERTAHGTHAARAAELAGLLKAAEDAKNRTEGELAKQIQGLQGKVQSQEARAVALATRARAYTALHKEVMDAFNFLQGEIGRPEVAAVVGYLLNYSVANLMDTLLAPNPALERAMLSNIGRIAGCVSNLPHVRKAAATADGLFAGLGPGAIAESANPHPYATHIGGLLRIVRNQMNVEVAPFYVAVDGDGKAHAVYI